LKTVTRKPLVPISQKALAAYLHLSPSTVSLVLNNAPLAAAIPEQTKRRVLEAAKEFDYRPDLYAKYLFSKKSYAVAVLLPEIGEGFSAAILGGIDDALVQKKYAFFIANHHADKNLIREYPRQLVQRAVEGFILINTPITEPLSRPTVSIGNEPAVGEMMRIMLDNYRGGWLAAEHLIELGHTRIAVIKGHSWRPASEERWRGISAAATSRGIKIDKRLVLQLVSKDKYHLPSTPEEGYLAAQRLLANRLPFTAIIAFNDFTALGAIRACHEAGIRVPQDISVIGFDDIQAAAYQIPGLTTLRQPLRLMGELAGSHLLKLISSEDSEHRDIVVEPELIVRESTCPLSSK
jgi:DNA-binding LacI/PurR family transcriptional regulator